MLTIEFCLLGEIEFRVDGLVIPVRGVRQQCLLAVLLAEAGRPVTREQLLDRAWPPDRLPARPANAVHTQITLLRRTLAPAVGVTIAWAPTGYRLTVDQEAVDVHRFRRLLRTAHAAAEEQASPMLQEALGLWRGELSTSLDTPWLAALRTRLAGEHRAARLDLTDARLRHGDHNAVLAELVDQVRDHPWDERLAGQLMLALYRNGRSAEALRSYQRIRRRLADELGVDPGPALRELHQRILTAGPDTNGPDTVASATESARPAVPRQLPAPPTLFTGRARELDELTATLTGSAEQGGTVVIAAVGGAGGIGKTWLALHWAHRNLDRFPDGQLYVNLRGFDPSGHPLPPTTAVRGFLDALGVPPSAIPVDLDAQVGLYRSLTAGRRLLIVADNARGTDQVAALLPGSPSCTVLVTSRQLLGGLVTTHGARLLTLGLLEPGEARELLAGRLGRGRIEAEPDAVADIVDRCDGLPLALGIVAARVAGQPDRPLAALAAELAIASERLDALDGGAMTANLRAVFSWSRQALTEETTVLFGLLGLVPGPDIGLAAVAALNGQTPTRVGVLLRRLEAAHLVTEQPTGRYRMHDLTKLYAAEQEIPKATESAALRRLVDHHLGTAHAGERLLEPHRPPIRIDPCPVPPRADDAAALDWFLAEQHCVLAAVRLAVEREWHQAAWQLAWSLDTFHHRRGLLHDNAEAWRSGLAAAQRLGDPVALGWAHRRFGHVQVRLGRQEEGINHLCHALEFARQLGDMPGQGNTHRFLALAWADRGDDHRAEHHAGEALRVFQAIDDPVGEANAHNVVGRFQARLGRYEDAKAHCLRALDLHRRHADQQGEANALDSLGYLAHQAGDHAAAVDRCREALALQYGLGNTYDQACTLELLGRAHHTAGNAAEAAAAWRQALTLYRAQLRTRDAARVESAVDSLDVDSDSH